MTSSKDVLSNNLKFNSKVSSIYCILPSHLVKRFLKETKKKGFCHGCLLSIKFTNKYFFLLTNFLSWHVNLVDIIVVSFRREIAQQSVLGFLFWGQFRIVTCYNFLTGKNPLYSGSMP